MVVVVGDTCILVHPQRRVRGSICVKYQSEILIFKRDGDHTVGIAIACRMAWDVASSCSPVRLSWPVGAAARKCGSWPGWGAGNQAGGSQDVSLVDRSGHRPRRHQYISKVWSVHIV